MDKIISAILNNAITADDSTDTLAATFSIHCNAAPSNNALTNTKSISVSEYFEFLKPDGCVSCAVAVPYNSCGVDNSVSWQCHDDYTCPPPEWDNAIYPYVPQYRTWQDINNIQTIVGIDDGGRYS